MLDKDRSLVYMFGCSDSTSTRVRVLRWSLSGTALQVTALSCVDQDMHGFFSSDSRMDDGRKHESKHCMNLFKSVSTLRAFRAEP